MKAQSKWYWMTVAACCGLAASSVGVFTNSVGIFYTPVSDALQVGRGAFALHATLGALTLGILSPAVAGLLKKVRLRLLLLIGVLLSSGSTALMSLADRIELFYLLGIIRGIGMTTFSLMPITTIIGNWFRKKHGLAVGIALSFSGLAGAAFNPVMNALIEQVGWQSAYLYMALFGGMLALPGVLILRFTPQEVGLMPYGNREFAGEDKTAAAETRRRLPRAPLLILAVMTLLHTSITGIAQHFPGMAETIGLTAATGAAMVSAGMIGNIVSKLAIGTLSDRIGPFRASIAMILVNMLSLMGLLLLPPEFPAAILAASFLYGSVYSVGAVGIPLLTRAVFGAENYASAYAVMTLCTNVGSASALTVIGLVYDWTGGYSAALVGGVLIDLLNLCVLIVLSRMNKRREISRAEQPA